MIVILRPMKWPDVRWPCVPYIAQFFNAEQDGFCYEDVVSDVNLHFPDRGRSVQCVLPEETVLSFGCLFGTIESQYGGKFGSLFTHRYSKLRFIEYVWFAPGEPSITGSAIPLFRCCTSKVL